MSELRDGRWASIGRVGRPHGREGAFVVEAASDVPERFDVGRRIYAGGEPAQVVDCKRAGGRPVIRLDRSVERGVELELPADELPQPDDGSYYVFQLVGLAVEDDAGNPMGRVLDVAPGVAHDVLELETGQLLPLVGECVLSVDVDRGSIVVERSFVTDG